MRLPSILLSVLLTSGFVPVAAQQPVDSVSLRFDWPVGMTADVEQEFLRLQETPERRDSTHVRSAYRLRVRDHAEGRLVEIDSHRATALKALVTNALSPEVLTAGAAQEWNAVAGTWVRADWEVGAVYEMTAEEPIPFLAGQNIPMRYEFAAVERTPCTDADDEDGCVILSMTSAPDSAALEAMVRGFLSNLMPEQRPLAEAMRNMRSTSELSVVADPRTLQPYWVELVKRVAISMAPVAGEAGGSMTRVDRRTATYTYRR